MSASDEGCVWGAGLSPEGEEPADGAPGRPGFPWGLAVGRDLGAPRSREGDGAFPDPEGFESEWERLETGGRVLRGREGRPGSPADAQGPTLGYLADEATTALLQQLTDREALRVRRNPSPESCATQVSTLWVDVEAGSAGRGVLAQSWAGAQLASAAPLHPWAPRGGRAWGYAKRGAVGRPARGGGRQRPSGGGLLRPPSDSSDSSDEVAEIQLMRVSICRREVSQARACSPEGPGDSGRQPSFLQAPGPFPSSAARGLGPLAERQAVGELGASPEKVPSAVWGKAGGRPGYAGAAGGPPRAAPRRKAAQEKKPAGGAPKAAVGRSFPSWGQRASAAPPEPATFPTISGVRLLGRGKKHPSAPAPWSARQFKPSGAGRRPPARRGPESEPVAGEDAEPRRDPAAKGQEPRPSGPCAHRGERGEHAESSSGDFSARAPQFPGRTLPRVLMNQVDVLPRGPATSSDQEPVGRPQRLEREQQPSPGAAGCPRCLVLQREVDDLKERLASMQCLVEKFEDLRS